MRFKQGTAGDAPVGFGDKIKNIFRMNYRGIIGFFVPFFALIWQGDKLNHPNTIQCMWIFMGWCLLLQPVHLPVAGLIPVFVLPFCGILNSVDICLAYINESICLFLLGTMINMLLNNSGFDRRIVLCLIRAGPNSAYNTRTLVFKSATAAFVMSIFSNRQMVTNDIITFLAPTLLELKGSPEADFDKLRAILCTAVHVGATLVVACSTITIISFLFAGSLVFPHGSSTILYMRSMFYASPKSGYDFPDVFNYMQYIIFVFPVALIMFLLSTIFFMILVGCVLQGFAMNLRLNLFGVFGPVPVIGKALSSTASAQIGGALKKHKDALPKHLTLHEKETIFFMAAFLIMCLTRWCKFMDMGWATFAKDAVFPTIPKIRDGVCCAIFVVALFSLPKGFGWLKYLTAKKYKDLPPAKPESGILFWRFVDKNVQYGYIFLFGAGCAVSKACLVEAKGFGSLGDHITNNLGKIVTDQSWPVSAFIICFISTLLANMMPGIGAATLWTPFVVNMARDGAPGNWESKLYLGLLASGLGHSLGFMWPFLHTPAYFTHYVGKTPKGQMAKTAVGAVIICMIVLWVAITFVAPMLWDPNDDGGFIAIVGPSMTTPKPTTAAPDL